MTMMDGARTRSRVLRSAIQPGYGRQVWLVIGLVAGYVATSVAGSMAFRFVGIPRFDLAIGLVLPYAMLFGGVGVLATVGGTIVGDVLNGTIGVTTLVGGAAHLFAGFVCYRLADRSWDGQFRSTRSMLSIIAIGLFTAAAAGAMTGWGYEVLGIAPFYLAGPLTISYLLAFGGIGVPALIGGLRYQYQSIESGRAVSRTAWMVGATLLGWLVIGLIASVSYYNLARIPAWALTDIGVGMLPGLITHPIIGPGAVHVQSFLAAVAIGTTMVLLTASRSTTARHTWS